MKYKLNHIDSKTLAPLLARLYFIAGAIAAAFMLVAAMFGGSNADAFVFTIIIFLIGYPIIGYITGLIFCAAYNFFCKDGSGLVFDLERIEPDDTNS